jgi:hypothetical protein
MVMEIQHRDEPPELLLQCSGVLVVVHWDDAAAAARVSMMRN